MPHSCCMFFLWEHTHCCLLKHNWYSHQTIKFKRRHVLFSSGDFGFSLSATWLTVSRMWCYAQFIVVQFNNGTTKWNRRSQLSLFFWYYTARMNPSICNCPLCWQCFLLRVSAVCLHCSCCLLCLECHTNVYLCTLWWLQLLSLWRRDYIFWF